MRSLTLLFLWMLSFIAIAETPPTPTFEIILGEAAEQKIRILFDDGVTENPFLYRGETADRKPCTLKLETASNSGFTISISQAVSEKSDEEKEVAKLVIGSSASLTRSTRDFKDYFSEHYKLFIPSMGGFDVLEHRKHHENSDFQLVLSSSMYQDKWFSCGSPQN